MLAQLPKYAAGLKVPVCEYTKAENLERGMWVVEKFSDRPTMFVVLSAERIKGKVYVDYASYPSTERVYPWRTTKAYKPDTLVVVMSGTVG